MSAINPIIQTPPRLNPDQFNSGAGQNTAPAAQQGFSDTLNSVGAKPVRKSASGKAQHADGGGDTLPAAGNHSPHTTPPGANAAANAVAGTAGAPVSPVTDFSRRRHITRRCTVGGHRPRQPMSRPAPAQPSPPPKPLAKAQSAPRRCGCWPADYRLSRRPVRVGKKDGVSAQDALAAAIDSSGAPESLPGQAGEIPQSTTAKPAALASRCDRGGPGSVSGTRAAPLRRAARPKHRRSRWPQIPGIRPHPTGMQVKARR